MPKDKELPAPADDYLEIECAKLHGGWGVWQTLPLYLRGKLMAHEMEKNMRDRYYLDVRKPSAAGLDESPKQGIADFMRNRLFNKPKPAFVAK